MLPYEKVRPIHEHKLASFAGQAEILRARREARAGVFGAMAGVVGKSLSAIKSVGSPRKARPAV